MPRGIHAIVAGAAFLLIVTGGPARAGTIHVPGDYATIQAGIDAAQPGDRVLVAEGTWRGPGNRDLDFRGKAIKVRGENGPENCIIDCEGRYDDPHRAFYFHSGETADAEVKGFTITGGNGVVYGGAIRCRNGSSPTIRRCIITHNEAVYGCGLCCQEGASPTLIRSTISHGRPSGSPGQMGGGIYCIDSSVAITDCTITANAAETGGGGIFARRSEVVIRDTAIIRNGVSEGPGGGFECDDSVLTMTNCTIADNWAGEPYDGGGGRVYGSDVTLINCTIAGNRALYGDGCGGDGCGGIVGGGIEMTNCVVWGNRPPHSSGTARFSCVEGGRSGDGNIDADPRFVDAEAGDYRLLPGSPCIDAGDNTAVPEGVTTDLDGNPRFADDPHTEDTGNGEPPVVDMGPYEFQGRCQPEQTAKLTASDGVGGDYFGSSLSISGDVAVIGADGDDDNGAYAGAAYVFRHDGATWVEETKLTASDGAAGDEFGVSVSISGDVALIGAYGDDDNGEYSGSAYVFRHDGAAWVQEAKLTASDGAAGHEFGWSVSISGDVAVIGAWGDDDNGDRSGSAYVFRHDGAAWVQEAKLTASDGATDDRFGNSLSIGGDVAVIGATFNDDNGDNSGSAYVFRDDGATWVEEANLTASDGAAQDYFGRSVSISGDVAVIGAWGDDDNGSGSGSAYVFRYDGATWVETANLTASDGAPQDRFGYSVSINGDVAVIGADRDDDNGDNSGSAYVFHDGGATWVEDAKLTASDGAERDIFGANVSISGDAAIVGARLDDDNGGESGSAYVFDLNCPNDCPADLDGDGTVAFGDILALLAAWGACEGCPEDLDENGIVDMREVLVVLGSWGPCPE